MTYPHPKKGFTGYDPGNPEHVAALEVHKVGHKWCAVLKGPAPREWSDAFVAYSGPTRFSVDNYLVRASRLAQANGPARAGPLAPKPRGGLRRPRNPQS